MGCGVAGDVALSDSVGCGVNDGVDVGGTDGEGLTQVHRASESVHEPEHEHPVVHAVVVRDTHS